MNPPQTNALKNSNVYWGDAHLNLEGHNFDRIDELFEAARRNMDFWIRFLYFSMVKKKIFKYL